MFAFSKVLMNSMAGPNITYKSLCSTRHWYHNTFRKFLHNHSKINALIFKPQLDFDYLCNPENKEEIAENIRSRKGIGNISRVLELHYKLQNGCVSDEEKSNLLKELEQEASRIPNRSSPELLSYGTEPRVINVFGKKREFEFKPKEFSNITSRMRVMRTDNLSNLVGHKSFYFMGQLAELEHALVKFAVTRLLVNGFQLVSVPDILPAQVIESCGMNIQGDRTQVYKLDPKLYNEGLCLSGTSEMALAAFVMNQELQEKQLPLKLAAVSRCYRAETSKVSEEKGVYRVHQFTKVEMFGVTTQDTSNHFLKELQELQEQMFTSLDLHCQTLDMPPHELGAPAFRKLDVEAWMPGRNMFGEVSSCSNCTDYQARRLNIKYHSNSLQEPVHAHTVNGTACAIPRTLIALLETHQQADGTVRIPQPLQQHMNGRTILNHQENVPVMKFVKFKIQEPKS